MAARSIGADKRGFALPLVLGMIAVLALAMIAALSALASLRNETKESLAGIEFDRAAVTAEARVEFLMLTEPLGPKGVRIGGVRDSGPNDRGNTDATTLLYADDRSYRWRENGDAPLDYRAALQDEAGLVNLYQADSPMISRLMQQAGLTPDNGDQLASELIDYNAQPAPHEPLKKLAELYSLPSGKDLISDRTFSRLDGMSAVHADSNQVNINTASREVLKAWFDLSDSQIDQAFKDRDATDVGLGSPSSIGAQVTGPLTNFTFPGGRMRFIFSDPRTGHTYRSTLVLTPNSQEKPIWVENTKTQRQKLNFEPAEDALEDFPEIPSGAP